MTKDALLEIGSEELPASFIAPGMRQLKVLAEESLKASELPFAAIDVFGTPRRLAVVIHGLADRSPDQKKVISGPPAAIAKDAQGQWTAAALGFARKQGLKPSDLTIENDKLTATLHIKGVATRQLLGDLFPQWISQLEFPKSMEWEPGHFRYPRPIRWTCALYGPDLVSFSLAGVRSTRWTLGIGPWAPKKIPVVQAGKYALLLKNQCVLVDPAGRREAIQRFADQAVKRVHGKLHLSAALLEQVANLVEHPVAILGNFAPGYLDLPKEVLITCLEHHQKYFPVEQASGGKLLPHFVGIRNGISVNQEVVREGYERVLAARLADARFFFNQDRKSPLASKVEALKGVMFQQKLGSLYDKQKRIEELLFKIFPKDNLKVLEAIPAARLCKADLVTEMVREFPELQGIMARIYARADGESEEMAAALEQHYWPITLTSPLPESAAAAAVALADKLDTLAGDFSVGLIPTGSADPYGLRRAAVGVLRIADHYFPELSIKQMVELAVSLQPIQDNAQETMSKLSQFMRQRFAANLEEEKGFKSDEIEAVLALGLHSPVFTIIVKIQSLHNFRKLPDFESLAGSFKRVANIVRQAREKQINFGDGEMPLANLMVDSSEKDLWKVYSEVDQQTKGDMESEQYLKSLVPLKDPLSKFFDGVMVMAEDQNLQFNRLRLLHHIANLFHKVADFSKLQNA